LLLLVSAYEYYCARDYDEAVAEYNRAIAIWPHNAYYYLMRGRAFAKAGERDKGIEDLKTALAMEGDNKDFLRAMEIAEQNRGIWKQTPAGA